MAEAAIFTRERKLKNTLAAGSHRMEKSFDSRKSRLRINSITKNAGNAKDVFCGATRGIDISSNEYNSEFAQGYGNESNFTR
jgi:hypothetical protein